MSKWILTKNERYNENTMEKVRQSLSSIDLDAEQINNAVDEMQSRGLLFRERGNNHNHFCNLKVSIKLKYRIDYFLWMLRFKNYCILCDTIYSRHLDHIHYNGYCYYVEIL